MPQRSPIEWTDYTSNPTRFTDGTKRVKWACVKVSPGCANCYAEGLSQRFEKRSYTVDNMRTLQPVLDEKELHALLASKAISGKMVFLGDMTDIFGEWVPDEFLDKLFAVMALRPDVTFQVLTKRSKRMRKYCESAFECDDIAVAMCEIAGREFDFFRTPRVDFPLPNVWLGVSVEDQQRADERIPDLLDTPAAVRFVSAEPLLGPIELHRHLDSTTDVPCCQNDGCEWCDGTGTAFRRDLNWVIVGGESGTRARPCVPAWIRSIVEQCEYVSVPVFVKQLGQNCQTRNDDEFDGCRTRAHDDVDGFVWPEHIETEDRIEHNPNGYREDYQGAPVRIRFRDRKGGDQSEWLEDLRVRQWPTVEAASCTR